MTSPRHRPGTAQELLDMVRASMENRTRLEIIGTGSKRRLGRAVEADAVLDMSALAGITLYEPEELVMTAAAGTLLAEIETALAARHQLLAFEPLDLGPLYGLEPGAGTLGGMVSCGLAGPRRIAAGAVRDHVLGLEAVTGHGTLVKAGGRVVKNVTGYDVPKLMAGSYGTLAALVSLTLKVMPAPQEERTITLVGPGVAEGLRLMRQALGGVYAISGAAYLPGWATASYDHQPVVFLRLEGFAASVAARFDALRALLREHGAVRELEGEASADVWRTFRQLGPALADDADDLWRLSLPPMASAELALALERELGARYWLDWAGGLLWLLAPPGDHAALIRERAAAAGGHATCLRGGTSAPFHPLGAAKLALTRRIKAGFDPLGLFNPGRMYEGV